jgi:hypothetical protein
VSESYDRRAIVDRAQTVNLADVGSPGYDLATVVDSDGESYPVLVRRSDIGNLTVGITRVSPAHEQLGEWRIAESSEPTGAVDIGHRVMRWPDQR